MPGLIQKLIGLAKWVAAPEVLPQEPAGAAPRAAGRPGFSRWVLHGDTLEDDVAEGLHAGTSPGFFRTVFAPDSLPETDVPQAARPTPPPRFWPWILAADTLPAADPVDREEASRTTFFTRLMQPEVCPESPGEGIEAGPGFFRRLAAPESCPSQTLGTPPAKPGFTRWILGREACPVDSTSAPTRRPGFWGKLFAPEEL